LKRRGFTLLELLIVVGLIALLSGLLVMAIGHMRTSAKRQQTTVMLENLRAMYADYDAMAHRHFVSYRDPLYNGNNVDMPCPQNVTNDFAGMAPASLTTLPISLDRNGYAVLLARDVMNQMRQTTTNATSLGKMPASSLMRFTQTAAPAPFNPTTTTPYHMLDRVYVMSINPTTFTYYTCIEYNPPVGIPPLVVPPPNTNFWFPSTFYANDPTAPTLVGADNTAPVGLDAWGNPIIFVPG
jgi:prepilin-type N-terminal cleavage/methylation domain-containing protein